MKVVPEYPPNYEQICAAIPAVRQRKTICFTYGDTVYSPAGIDLRPDLIAHEAIHVERQGKQPAEWWDKYLSDVEFRLQEELNAYRVQYGFAVKHYRRDARRVLLTSIAKDLAGSMYGKLITKKEAISLITEGSKI